MLEDLEECFAQCFWGAVAGAIAPFPVEISAQIREAEGSKDLAKLEAIARQCQPLLEEYEKRCESSVQSGGNAKVFLQPK